MGQSRTAILYGLLPNDVNGLPDDATANLGPGIEYTEDGVLGARVGVAYDDRHPPLILPLDLESMDTLSRAIERAHKRWERFSDKLRMLGVREIPRARLILTEVERR